MKQLKINTLVITTLLLALPVLASAQKDLDSILNETVNMVYEDPNYAISTGENVFSRATQNKTKIKALRIISNAYLSKRDNEKSLEYLLKARDYLTSDIDLKSRISILNSIGMQHQQLRIYDKAIVYLDEAIVLSKEIENDVESSSLLGYNYTVRGFIYREQMSCEIALNYFDKAIFQYKKVKDQPGMTGNLSTLTYNKGNCFLQIAQLDSARTNFNTSVKYAEEVGANSLLAFAKKGLSEVYTAEGNYLQAIEELQQAENKSTVVGDLILNQGIYKNLYDNYLAINDRENYQNYFSKYTTIKNEIVEKEESTINNSIKGFIKDTQSETRNTISKINKTKWVVIFTSSILLLIVLNLTFRNYKEYRGIKEKLKIFIK